MFENKMVKDIHATRFIMSWVREGGTLDAHGRGYDAFEKWLKSLGLTSEEIYVITDIAKNGKMELEISAKRFLKGLNNQSKEEA